MKDVNVSEFKAILADDIVIEINEGSGSALSKEDTYNGYVDYIDYYIKDSEGNDIDGGISLLKYNYRNMFKTPEEVLSYLDTELIELGIGIRTEDIKNAYFCNIDDDYEIENEEKLIDYDEELEY